MNVNDMRKKEREGEIISISLEMEEQCVRIMKNIK